MRYAGDDVTPYMPQLLSSLGEASRYCWRGGREAGGGVGVGGWRKRRGQNGKGREGGDVVEGGKMNGGVGEGGYV